MIDILNEAAVSTYTGYKKCKHKTNWAGWNKHVRKSHLDARMKFNTWVQNGKPFSGQIYSDMVELRKIFKGKLKWCQNHQDRIKMDLLAIHHSNTDFKFLEKYKQVKQYAWHACEY